MEEGANCTRTLAHTPATQFLTSTLLNVCRLYAKYVPKGGTQSALDASRLYTNCMRLARTQYAIGAARVRTTNSTLFLRVGGGSSQAILYIMLTHFTLQIISTSRNNIQSTKFAS
ncbi:hypothetical protein COEREDRAFT_82250, partial [Coemansia reversa NRRL 1564]